MRLIARTPVPLERPSKAIATTELGVRRRAIGVPVCSLMLAANSAIAALLSNWDGVHVRFLQAGGCDSENNP